jgi:pilus assembly protein CpaB
VVGVAGFVTPGMRVDVLASGTPPGADQQQGTESKTILQNIEVLSAGTDIQKDAEGKPQQVQVVNLLVTPDQAQTLTLAASQLRIQLVLRNPLDTKITPVATIAMGKMFADQGGAPPPQHHVVAKPAPKPAAPAYSIQVINGSSSTEQKFSTPEGSH